MSANNKALLIKTAALTVALFVLWRVAKPLRDALNTIDKSLDSASESAGETLSDVDAYLNGYEPVALSEARFYLNDKYIGTDFEINREWKNIMQQAHPDIESLFNEITDNQGRLKLKYHHLINGEVSAATINEVNL